MRSAISRLLALPTLLAFVLLALAACADGGGAGEGGDGGGSDGGGGSEGLPAGGGGDNGVTAAAPGTATVVVDGQTLEFPQVGAICNFDDTGFSFGFLAPDGTSVAGGVIHSDGSGWLGSFTVRLLDADGYEASVPQDGGGLRVDGRSITYRGEWEYQPRNDGSLPTPRPVGEGTIAAACP